MSNVRERARRIRNLLEETDTISRRADISSRAKSIRELMRSRGYTPSESVPSSKEDEKKDEKKQKKQDNRFYNDFQARKEAANPQGAKTAFKPSAKRSKKNEESNEPLQHEDIKDTYFDRSLSKAQSMAKSKPKSIDYDAILNSKFEFDDSGYNLSNPNEYNQYLEDKEKAYKNYIAGRNAADRMRREAGDSRDTLQAISDWGSNKAEETAKAINTEIGIGPFTIKRYASDREQFREMYGVYPEQFGKDDLKKAADKLGVKKFSVAEIGVDNGKETWETDSYAASDNIKNILNDVNIKIKRDNGDTVINNWAGHAKNYRSLSDDEREFVRLARLYWNNNYREINYDAVGAFGKNAANELLFGLLENNENYTNSIKHNRDEYSYVTMLNYQRAANDSGEFKKLYGVEPTKFTKEKLNELKNERGIGLGSKHITEAEYKRLEMLANVIDNQLYNDAEAMNELKSSDYYGYVSMIMGDMQTTPAQKMAQISAEHPIASTAGSITGGVARTVLVDRGVGHFMPNASAPLRLATTMGIDSGLHSLGSGEDPGKASIKAATGFVGGAIAGKAGEYASELINKGITGKAMGEVGAKTGNDVTKSILGTELKKAGLNTVAKGTAMTAANYPLRKGTEYLLDRDNFQISPQEIAQEFLTNLLFAGIGEFKGAVKRNNAYQKAAGDQFMEELGKKIAVDYDKIRTNPDSKTAVKKAGDVIAYTDEMLEHLDNIEKGKPISVETADGVKELKVKLTGQKKNIAELRNSLNKIKTSAREYVDGNNGAIIVDEWGNVFATDGTPTYAAEPFYNESATNSDTSTTEAARAKAPRNELPAGDYSEVVTDSDNTVNAEQVTTPNGEPAQTVTEPSVPIINNENVSSEANNRAEMVTENVTNSMNARTGAPSQADNMQSANSRIQSDSNTAFDRNFVRDYTKDFLIGMAQRNNVAFRALQQMDGYVGDELVNEVVDGSAAQEYKNNNYFRMAADELKNIIADAAEKNVIMHNRAYGENEQLSQQAAAMKEGDFSVVNTQNRYGFTEVSAEDKLPGLIRDEHSEWLTSNEANAIDELAARTGRTVKFTDELGAGKDGCYLDGVLYISTAAQNPYMVVMAHELTHSGEGTEAYIEYANAVIERLTTERGKSIGELEEEKIQEYADGDIKLTTDEAHRELVAEFSQRILGDENAAREFINSIEDIEQRKSVLRHIIDFFKNLINSVKGKFSKKQADINEMENIKTRFENMLAEMSEETSSQDGEAQFLYGGDNAKTADLTAKAKAIEMEQAGASNEEIRQATKWARGLDNEWKFELDDSKAKYIKADLGGKKKAYVKLSDILEYDELYEAYPDLRDVPVRLTENNEYVGGEYLSGADVISINQNTDFLDETRKTLLHEVQHAIQAREGFAEGTSYDPEHPELYENSAGEIEANDVKTRANLTAEERKAIFPESMKPREGVIVNKATPPYENPAPLVFDDKSQEVKSRDDVGTGNRVKITRNMTDEERYDVLKNREMDVVTYNPEKMQQVEGLNENELNTQFKKAAKPLLNKIADEFNVFKSYSIEDIELEANYSHGSFNESTNKQHKNYQDFGKLLTVFDDVIKNAVGIEVHDDIYKGTQKENPNLLNTYVLISAFQDGEDTIPVKLVVKELDNDPNKIHLTVSANKIKAEISAQASGETARLPYAPSASTISLSEMFKKINPKDAYLLKYVPEQFLTDEQKAAVREENVKDRQRIQPLTKDFKQWFGDWQNDPESASKVVNEDGTPKVVYHGTKADFTVFDKNTFGKNMFNAFGNGFYFTDKKSVTRSYGSNVIKAYLSIKNPYHASDSEATRLRTEDLIAKGYDGVVLSTAPNEHIYVAFEPTQIKSATDNIGTFDTNNPDIRYAASDGKGQTANAAARDIIKTYNATGRVYVKDIQNSIKDLATKVQDVFYGEGDVEKAYPAFEAEARRIATYVVDNARVTDDVAREEFDRVRKYVKGMRIKITDELRNDIPDFNKFRQSVMGTVTLTKDGTPIDILYKEMVSEFPQHFDEEKYTSQSDQLYHIIATVDNLRPQEMPLSESEYDTAVEDLTADIITRAINMSDKYKPNQVTDDSRYDAKDWDNILTGDEAWRQKELQRREESSIRNKERERFEKRLQRYKDKVQEQKRRAAEIRKESEDRTRLLNIARRFNNMKLSPENKAKIPEAVFEIDTVSKGILKKGYTTEDGRVVMGELDLKQLRDSYLMIKDTDPDFIPDPNVEAKIGRLDKMQVNDMEISDVRELLQTLQQVEHEIRTNNKMLQDKQKREIAQVAAKSIGEIRGAKGIKDNVKGSAMDKFWSTQLNPLTYARRLTGWARNSQFYELFDAINEGQLKSTTFKQKAMSRFDELALNRKEMQRFTGKKAELIDISKYDTEGRKVYITPAMRTALYLHSKNYSNLRHIQYGGITVPDMTMYNKGRITDAYKSNGMIIRLTPSQVRTITSEMTDFEKRFADAVYKFFNEDCKAAVNETSLALNGYEKAVVKDYFPISSNKNFVNMEFESLKRDGTYEGMGMLKERKYSGNPIVLEDVVKVVSRHMNDVGDYSGLAVPIRNFNKVYNSMGSKYAYSTKQAISEKWGSNASNYIENLMTDLQGGRSEKGMALLKKLNSNYAQATLSFNVGVTLQQAGSYPTAAAVLGYKPLMQAFSEHVTKEDKEIIAQYTPLLWYRSQGYTTRELGDYTNGNDADWTKKGKMPWLMGWIQKMDVATTTKLWKASEFYVRDNFKDLEKGSDEYYTKVAEIYNKVIETTQPNYTTMQRADLLRNPNAIIKATSMFRTQPSQNYNLLYDAFGEYKARSEEYKSNKNEENKAELNKSYKKLVWVITSQIIAAMVVNLFKGFGTYLKGQASKHYGGSDESDEGQVTLASAGEQYALDTVSTLAGNVWFGSDAVNVLLKTLHDHGISRGAAVYDTEAPSLSMMNDVVDDITTINKMFADGKTNAWNMTKKINKVTTHIGTMFGIPAKNVENLIGGVYKDISDATHSGNIFDDLDAWSEGFDRTYTDKEKNKFKANMSFQEFTEYEAFYEKTLEDILSGEITKKDGEPYAESGAKTKARELANEKYKHLFRDKVE